MNLFLLLGGIAASLIVFLIYSVSGSLFGKDTRANLPKWLSAVSTLVLGAYFALVEWESFLGAWNKYVLGTGQAGEASLTEEATTPVVTRWEILDGHRDAGGHTGDIIISASQEGMSLNFLCSLLTAEVNAVFPIGDPAHGAFVTLFGEAFGTRFDAIFRFADGRTVVLPMSRSTLVPDDPSIALHVPFDIRTPEINRKVDLVLDRIMTKEMGFSFSIFADGKTWTDPRQWGAAGLAGLWDEANRIPCPGGHRDQSSAECRKFQS